MKVRPRGPFYIFISDQEKVGNYTHSLQFLQSKIKLGNFIRKRDENKYHLLDEIEWDVLGDEHRIWIYFQSNKLHVGNWDNENGFITLGAFKIVGLSKMRILGFSSFEKSDWTIINGKY